ncbi:MAG: hypothetical protein OEY14_06380, partial [Myxococcales bacterium]|nr:hypothetical protein [Myxococcales bacterium]
TLCVMDGVDYDRVRDSGVEMDDFSDGYIGDYVTKLENLVESYRLDHPFSSGQDTAVVSLRDDVSGVHESCEVPSRNLLVQSDSLGMPTAAGVAGWDVRGLSTDPAATQGIGVRLLSYDGYLPLRDSDPRLGSPDVFRVTFGPRWTEDLNGDRICPTLSGPDCVCLVAANGCALQENSRVAQSVTLPAGRYRLSWYGRASAEDYPYGCMTPDCPEFKGLPVADALNVVEAASADAVSPPAPSLLGPAAAVAQSPELTPEEFGTYAGSRFLRYWSFFSLDTETTVEVQIVNGREDLNRGQPREVDLAGIMLEDVTSVVPAAGETVPQSYPPPAPEATDSNGEVSMAVCEDTDGSTFRDRLWQYGCESLCTTGFAQSCPDEARTEYCFWQSQFTVTQADIDGGRMFARSGFARGNYNYRVAAIGLNFVGTGVRDCSASEFPSTCYAAGFVPYSIEHLGPYTVLNTFGGTYDAPLFNGRIEHARGLAVERYLTNPLSSADRALIEPYTRQEMAGRPLDGTYVIRIWDEPGVMFSNIEDVQIILNYRYWTRLD